MKKVSASRTPSIRPNVFAWKSTSSALFLNLAEKRRSYLPVVRVTHVTSSLDRSASAAECRQSSATCTAMMAPIPTPILIGSTTHFMRMTLFLHSPRILRLMVEALVPSSTAIAAGEQVSAPCKQEMILKSNSSGMDTASTLAVQNAHVKRLSSVDDAQFCHCMFFHLILQVWAVSGQWDLRPGAVMASGGARRWNRQVHPGSPGFPPDCHGTRTRG